MESLTLKANQIRIELLKMIYNAKTGHTGGALSSTDILIALYYSIMNIDPDNPDDENRDRFILSKGHCVEGLLCILADRGFIHKEELKNFSKYNSVLIGHPTNKIAGIEMCSGALGHGLSVGVGMALGAKLRKKDYKTYILMGDGEQAEGSIWEAAMAGSYYKLDNLFAIIDRNHLQISGNTETVMGLGNLAQKWEAFGWNVYTIDGHDIYKIINELASAGKNKGKPHIFIAETIKGKGVSFIENETKWHHKVPTEEQLLQAICELGGTENEYTM